MSPQFRMRVLIYKRTHVGDPSPDGVFGIHDCMRSVRGRDFDAVIGLGGISSEPRSHGINGKINWIGVGAHKTPSSKFGLNRPYITFDHFSLFDHRGPEVAAIAPGLATHMYNTNRRVVMSDSLPPKIAKEVTEILKMAKKAPALDQKRESLSRASACAPKKARKCR